MRTATKFLAASFVLPIVIVLASAGPASAHEQRLVAGKYNFTVGWGDEPTYSGFKNSAQLILADAAKKPIIDLGDTLRVEVTSGAQKATFPIAANFDSDAGQPGDYRAWFIPTRPGTYAFHFTGTIHGDKVDETFTSSETTFDDARDATEVEFPAKDPSAGQLADRVTQEAKRTAAQLSAAQSSIKASNDNASKATIFAIVGIVVGALGLVVGGIGFARKR